MPVIIEDNKQMFINEECDNMWSLVGEIVEQATENSDAVARITFLVEDAPHYLLYEGNKFELWDGKTVGVGEVII
ncbi:hypothetical protein GCM10008018_64870 [Paenibacillus marchantiophytorum]|uniref:Uncharacterized protein n=1 Tax=Paenibacillus marchantiophytorum TaxID=1619310 RepID=A0ABQ1FFF4_9BACL|nr:hypothetical protein [Paenibacillus marchantiophytorum]GGA10553.1 hypothetical protein GCM10008018_64870 [Paenibacillus marchantiophytorum]